MKYTSAITPIFLHFGLLLSALGTDRDKDVCGLCLGKKHQSSVATATHCRGIFHRHYILKTKLYQLVINRIPVKDILFFIFYLLLTSDLRLSTESATLSHALLRFTLMSPIPSKWYLHSQKRPTTSNGSTTQNVRSQAPALERLSWSGLCVLL